MHEIICITVHNKYLILSKVEIILQAITKNRIEMKTAILQAEHRLSSKKFGVQEDLAEYRKQDAGRVCTVEDGINDIKREIQVWVLGFLQTSFDLAIFCF